MSLNGIIAELPGLSTVELEEVRMRITALLSLGGGSSIAPPEIDLSSSTQEGLVFEVIITFLKNRGVEFASPDRLRASAQIRSFRIKLPELFKYLEQVGRSARHHRALLTIGIELLYENMTSMNVPVTGITLMNSIHRLPACINRAFPGYAESGLLEKLIRI